MTREEILKRMDEIDTSRFYLAMKDRWDSNDREKDRNLLEEYLKLAKMVDN